MADILSKASIFQRPTKYKSGKVYGQIPQNSFADMDLVRAGTKYRMTSAGLLESVASGMPAIDWRGSTPAYNGLLVERAATNLILRSQEFDNASWTKTRVTISANAATGPDGTLTADRLTEDTSPSQDRGVSQSVSVVSGTTYTISQYIKPETQATNSFNLFGNAVIQLNIAFIPSTNTVTISGGAVATGISGSIQVLPNGWYRCICTFTIAYTGTLDVRTRMGNGNYTGTGLTTLYWGTQVIANPTPSSYIKTEGSTASRVADAYSKTGLSAYVNNTEREGTIVFCIRRDLQLTGAELMSLTQVSGSTTNRILLRTTATDQIEAVVVNSSSEVVNILSSTNQSGVLRIIFAYKDNDCQLYINGSSVGTDTGVTIPSNLEELFYGGVSVANNANFWMKLCALIPKRLSTTDVAALDAQLATAVT